MHAYISNLNLVKMLFSVGAYVHVFLANENKLQQKAVFTKV